MTSFPLVYILFWIALMCGPKDISQITITAPDQTWTWTKQATGWSQSVDHSLWTTEGNTVTRTFGDKTDKKDVTKFVQGTKDHDWSKSESLPLGPMHSLTRKGNSFVYTLNEGDPSAKKYTITFDQK